jgi:hypothetical protein
MEEKIFYYYIYRSRVPLELFDELFSRSPDGCHCLAVIDADLLTWVD